jgi:Adenylate and Guanylate cyclase catalytic domain
LTAAQWLDQVIEAERRGELLTAVDVAESGLKQHPHDVGLRHRAVLALARAGSTGEAARRFHAYRLGELDDEETQALGARIAKDVALAADGNERRSLALESARRYAAIFERTGGYYPGVNAATMHLVAGRGRASRTLALRVLDALAAERDESYYAAATEAEAKLLVGDEDGARAVLERAARLGGDDHGAVATTRRQLRLVCGCLGADPGVLEALAGPHVAHYCGHRVSTDGTGPLTPEVVASAAAAIRAEVERTPVSYAYGSLASGADLLWAETLIAAGAELHVVLPFSRDEFVAASVADAGPDWVERFERCFHAAADISYATDDAFLGDDVLYRYGSALAMGLALLRGRYLEGEVRQFALWDGASPRGSAGTAVDVELWSRGGRPVTVVPVAPPAAAPRPPVSEPARAPGQRVVRALLFGDVQGFSRLKDEQLPRFAKHIFGAFAEVFARHSERICFRNTWGDGLYVVLDNVPAAAAFALELQEAMDALDLEGSGLPPHLGLRLGAHVGPVFALRDPVLGVESFMGSHVSRTARIEPVTPTGAVYVTEQFAAALELASGGYDCDYVGHMPAAKDFGRLRMYRLRRRRRSASSVAQ